MTAAVVQAAPPRAQRQDWLDAVRGTAVLAVVGYHAVVALAVLDATPPTWLRVLDDAFSPLRIPLLVLLSGALLPVSLRKPAREYVDGKLRQIAWPWLVWTALTAAVLALGSRVAGDGDFGPRRVVEFVLDPRTHTWYLHHLLLYYLLSLVVPRRARALAVAPLLAGSALLGGHDQWQRLVFLLGVFWLGELLASRRPGLDPVTDRRAVAVAAVVLVAVSAASAGGLGTRYQLHSLLGVLAAAVLLGAAAHRWRGSAVVTRLQGLGRQSIVYYVTHWVVVALTANALAVLGRRVGLLSDPVVATAAMVAAALLVCAVAVRVRGTRWGSLLYALPARPGGARRG